MKQMRNAHNTEPQSECSQTTLTYTQTHTSATNRSWHPNKSKDLNSYIEYTIETKTVKCRLLYETTLTTFRSVGAHMQKPNNRIPSLNQEKDYGLGCARMEKQGKIVNEWETWL